MKKSMLINMGAALAMGIASFAATATPAAARDHDRYGRYDRGDYYGGRGYDRGYRGYDRDYRGYDRGYRGNSYNRGDRYYRSSYRCRDNGTGGTIIGAIAGGLLGNQVVGRYGDRTAGTVVGAGVGALAGRAIDRSDSRC
jgi:uncharacterized protein YcfJ